MTFPRFGPNGAFAFFSDERNVPPGWQKTAEDARLVQRYAPPVVWISSRHPNDDREAQDIIDVGAFVVNGQPGRHRKGRRR